jgi:predicted peptidase
MVTNIVKDMKRYFNIDDDKVFLSGHSNGATGVISYLLKSPSFFAGV